MGTFKRCVLLVALAGAVLAAAPARAEATDKLCDPANEDCRDILVRTIRSEFVGIDVAFWFMEDQWYANELIAKWRAGVPVRVIVDSRANSTYLQNGPILDMIKAAGIPMRERFTGGILHWKMMLFSGQGIVQFSGANYSPDAWLPLAMPLYSNYVDEAILFTDKPSIVNSFRTKYDDLWLNTTEYRNFANIVSPRVRVHDIWPKDPELNFAPAESYANRSVQHYYAETQRIDVIMYRITDRRHTDAMIDAVRRGIPVRLITEPKQYRDPTRLWHSWNVDRLYMAGVQIKHRKHAGLNHQKSVLLYGQRMAIFGSSNWTSPSAESQEEHNLFTRDAAMYQWFVNQFSRKWNNTTGVIENEPFVPLPPEPPQSPLPEMGATGVGTSVTLQWEGGFYAHNYDVYLGTSPNPPLLAANQALGPSNWEGQRQSLTVPAALQTGTTYYWRIVGKTMANQTATSPTWSFTTAGGAPPPPPPPPSSGDDIVVYGIDASARAGAWRVVGDGTAAGGAAMAHPDAGAAKLTAPLASPSNYFEVTFNAQAGRGYRIWIRGKSAGDSWANDSVFIQFAGSVTSGGAATWRIGTTSAAEYNLEDCSGCGLSGWGWQDNGWGRNVMGPLVYFAATGTQRMRIQTREDGLSIDQIVLSPSTFVSQAPGALTGDNTILSRSGGSSTQPPPPPPPPPPTSSGEIVLRASDVSVFAGGWRRESDGTAAGGQRVRHPDAGGAKVAAPVASPAHYFEVTFNAVAGTPYRIWIRGKADSNYWANDSVFVQFDRTVDSNGSAIWRIGTASGTDINLEDCSGCGLSEWGWQDNGWGVGIMGPLFYFSTTGTQRIRIQTREDGLSIDQIVISPSQFLSRAPGALKNDSTIVAR
jgi:phosphatidylserine/phosphatidylglycerophosphate/cardiolipin synthase-like enzyme